MWYHSHNIIVIWYMSYHRFKISYILLYHIQYQICEPLYMCDIIVVISCTILNMMSAWTCPARSLACILASTHSALARLYVKSSFSTAGWILLLAQWLSISGCSQMLRYVLCYAVCCSAVLLPPGFNLGWKSVTLLISEG